MAPRTGRTLSDLRALRFMGPSNFLPSHYIDLESRPLLVKQQGGKSAYSACLADPR
jgi:hypothetical protein